ncbi:LPS-assembly lipoprotein LptE [Chitinasiproducens palmae]|uniref:LPS-assembly lipoprotein LptE n=1 Tax=Chitinasiproducens palmae TaxID=1770053 RepID=UPI000B8071A7|nr:LPS assembly lipoprotein LptE [Chitinasiproducens palmae]
MIRYVCLILLLSLAACGFQLRGDYAFPFKRLYVAGAPNPETAALLKRMVEGGSETRIVTSPKDADATLMLAVTRGRGVLTLSVTGVAQEYVLTSVAQYSLVGSNGAVLVPPSTISVNRSMSYSDRYALAKDQEATLLYRDMDTDIVNQLLRRLTVVRTLDPDEQAVPGVNSRAPLPTPPL